MERLAFKSQKTASGIHFLNVGGADYPTVLWLSQWWKRKFTKADWDCFSEKPGEFALLGLICLTTETARFPLVRRGAEKFSSFDKETLGVGR